MCGVYLFADYVKGQLGGLRNDGKYLVAHKTLLNTNYHISSFGVDQAQEVYVVAHQAGKILKITALQNDIDSK